MNNSVMEWDKIKSRVSSILSEALIFETVTLHNNKPDVSYSITVHTVTDLKYTLNNNIEKRKKTTNPVSLWECVCGRRSDVKTVECNECR